MSASIAGFVLRANASQMVAGFYELLGLSLTEHSHGGPKHKEMGPTSKDAVFELYQRSSRFDQDALMIYVPSLNDVAVRLLAGGYGANPSEIKRTGDMKFVYVTDPDGRSVMLIERPLETLPASENEAGSSATHFLKWNIKSESSCSRHQ